MCSRPCLRKAHLLRQVGGCPRAGPGGRGLAGGGRGPGVGGGLGDGGGQTPWGPALPRTLGGGQFCRLFSRLLRDRLHGRLGERTERWIRRWHSLPKTDTLPYQENGQYSHTGNRSIESRVSINLLKEEYHKAERTIKAREVAVKNDTGQV